jgi:HK97 gp10 family phage protein
VLRLAIDVQNRARQLSPVDTGRLRSSINHKAGRDRKGYYVDVGSNVKYAPFVEFGTMKQPAQPYLRPALAEAVRAGLKIKAA